MARHPTGGAAQFAGDIVEGCPAGEGHVGASAASMRRQFSISQRSGSNLPTSPVSDSDVLPRWPQCSLAASHQKPQPTEPPESHCWLFHPHVSFTSCVLYSGHSSSSAPRSAHLSESFDHLIRYLLALPTDRSFSTASHYTPDHGQKQKRALPRPLSPFPCLPLSPSPLQPLRFDRVYGERSRTAHRKRQAPPGHAWDRQGKALLEGTLREPSSPLMTLSSRDDRCALLSAASVFWSVLQCSNSPSRRLSTRHRKGGGDEGALPEAVGFDDEPSQPFQVATARWRVIQREQERRFQAACAQRSYIVQVWIVLDVGQPLPQVGQRRQRVPAPQ
jgi:hypothetical protein